MLVRPLRRQSASWRKGPSAVTLSPARRPKAADGIFVRDLAWLLEAEPEDLGAWQRTIRGYVLEMAAGSDGGEGGQDPAGRGDKEEG
jgi:hypothetical protein